MIGVANTTMHRLRSHFQCVALRECMFGPQTLPVLARDGQYVTKDLYCSGASGRHAAGECGMDVSPGRAGGARRQNRWLGQTPRIMGHPKEVILACTLFQPNLDRQIY